MRPASIGINEDSGAAKASVDYPIIVQIGETIGDVLQLVVAYC
jgi:hypothetical protein